MAYETIIEQHGVYWRLYGDSGYDDILALNQGIWGSADWGKMHYQITNFLDVNTFNITEAQVILISHMDEAAALSTNSMNVALIANQPEIVALCNAYKKSLEVSGWEARLFDTLDAARAWTNPDATPV